MSLFRILPRVAEISIQIRKQSEKAMTQQHATESGL